MSTVLKRKKESLISLKPQLVGFFNRARREKFPSNQKKCIGITTYLEMRLLRANFQHRVL